MRVFWDKGYEGTSLDDLTSAMGINRSSLYATFGDKEQLFRKVIQRYSSGPLGFLTQALEKPTAAAVVEALLKGGVKFLADPGHPRGCLSLQGGLTCGTGAENVKNGLTELRNSGTHLIQRRLQRAQKERDLPPNVDPKDLARYITALLNGLSIQVVNGATESEMNRTVDLALRSLRLLSVR